MADLVVLVTPSLSSLRIDWGRGDPDTRKFTATILTAYRGNASSRPLWSIQQMAGRRASGLGASRVVRQFRDTNLTAASGMTVYVRQL